MANKLEEFEQRFNAFMDALEAKEDFTPNDVSEMMFWMRNEPRVVSSRISARLNEAIACRMFSAEDIVDHDALAPEEKQRQLGSIMSEVVSYRREERALQVMWEDIYVRLTSPQMLNFVLNKRKHRT